MRSPRRQRGFIQFLPLIAAGIGAAASHINTNKNNNANEAMSREQMSFNAAEAEKQRVFSASEAAGLRDWQAGQAQDQRAWSEQMSATSYQRAVGDLERAGLNPMLAYSQGGAPMPTASAPTGAMGSGGAASYSSLPQRQNAVQAGLASAAAAASVANIQADTLLKKAQATREVSSSGSLDATTQETLARIPKIQDEITELRTRAYGQTAKATLDESQTLLVRAQDLLAQGRIDQVEAETAFTKIRTKLAELELPAAKAYADKFSGEWGSNVTPFLREVVDILRLLILSRSR